MKAKRLRDGKIVEVEKHGDAMIDEDGKVLYFDEICEVDEPDWQQVRIQAAIAAMQGQLANDESVKQMIETLDIVALPDKTKAYMNLVARSSVMLADALVAELQKKREQ